MADNKNNDINLQPQAIEAEEAVLGSMMIDENATNKAITLLGSSHYFYKDSHKKIFDAMLSLSSKNSPIDTVSVSDELKKTKSLKSAGGLYYLTGLVDKVPTSANVEVYASIVKEKGILREVHSDRYYISDYFQSDAQFYHEGIRGHWTIENSLHWVKDVIIGEDNNQVKSGSGAINRAVCTSIAINIQRKNGQYSISEGHIENNAINVNELFELLNAP